MTPTHRKYQGRSDLDLALERRGTMSDLSADDRAAFARVAELSGCLIAGQHIQDAARRRMQVHAVPDGKRKPLASGTDRPILVGLDGEQATAIDPERAWWNDIRRACDRHDPACLSSPGRLFRETLIRAHSRHGA